MTSCKEDRDKAKPSCQGFAIGGNCNGQNSAIDKNTKIPPIAGNNIFQMGHFSNPNQRFGLNRVPPPIIRENEAPNRLEIRKTTTSPTPTTSSATTTTSIERSEGSTMSPELQEMRDHIMEMNAHDLRDAIMDPMMLGTNFYCFENSRLLFNY